MRRVNCTYCGKEYRPTSALLIRMGNGIYRCKGAGACVRRQIAKKAATPT